ncbi:MAG: GIY-YIG nuclease family protein [Ignavibacteria bacterium]|nr:GIY-YIG nuclease family protein [Ignavibacteria bacterium]
MFYVYILLSSKDSTFYVGQTNNLTNRLKKHNSGYVRSTRNKIPFKIVYFEEFQSRTEAMAREWEIKRKYNTERRRKLVLGFDVSKINELGL